MFEYDLLQCSTVQTFDEFMRTNYLREKILNIPDDFKNIYENDTVTALHESIAKNIFSLRIVEKEEVILITENSSRVFKPLYTGLKENIFPNDLIKFQQFCDEIEEHETNRYIILASNEFQNELFQNFKNTIRSVAESLLKLSDYQTLYLPNEETIIKQIVYKKKILFVIQLLSI